MDTAVDAAEERPHFLMSKPQQRLDSGVNPPRATLRR